MLMQPVFETLQEKQQALLPKIEETSAALDALYRGDQVKPAAEKTLAVTEEPKVRHAKV